MLVLSTRLNEKIFLPDTNTAIEVVAIQSGTVRLGITAPDDVPPPGSSARHARFASARSARTARQNIDSNGSPDALACAH